ncbi:chymotrypsin-2-like [Camponotus floridanus]|uniref:chymotrypsin-2-like n=1 Tax=Camponotus floridanus TaxID=104421 RepID=UPI00059E644B|nr:chymotrypsin-2-like [Camponotus floridanus]
MKQLSCILIVFAIVGIYADEPERLVNGVSAYIEDYPYMVSIRNQNNHMCGGNMISDRHILTAAHCVYPIITDSGLRQSVTIVSGTTWLNSGGQVHRISQMWYHESYNPNTLGNDIGLIKLSAPIIFNSRQRPIGLPTSDVKRGESLTIVAWGSTGFRQAVHNNLQKLNAKCMLPDECQRYHQNFMPIYTNEFCTLISYGTGACNGDSGSGVIRSDGTIAGVVSRGRPCAVDFPDVFTNIFKHIYWIRQKMVL